MNVVDLEPGHLQALMELKAAAGWNQTEDDWLRIMRLAPHGCVGIIANNKIVASATTINYEKQLSWIGMVLTLPEYRGQGLARKLMEAVLKRSTSTRVGLDASDMGKPLYASLGFSEECAIERWVRQPGTAKPFSLPPAGNVAIITDPEIFGANRSDLLRDLARYDSAQRSSAYAFSRPGAVYHYLGPWVAEDPRDARDLLRWFLGRHGEEATCVDLFPQHAQAVHLVSEHGFVPVRRLTRMRLRGAGPRSPDQRIYGIGGFEFG